MKTITKYALSLEAANAIIQKGLAKADELGANVTIAVLDNAGHLIAFNRMDHASLSSIDPALRKGKSSALSKKDTALLSGLTRADQNFMKLDNLPLPGGEPIFSGDEFVGAIGVSGSTLENDVAIAKAAIA